MSCVQENNRVEKKAHFVLVLVRKITSNKTRVGREEKIKFVTLLMMWITWMRRFSLFLFSRALTRGMMKLAWLSSQSLFALLTSCWFCCGCVFLCWTWGPSQLPHFSGFIIIIILIMRWDSSAATDSSMIKVVFVFIALHPLAWLKLVSCCYLPLLSASFESCKESAVAHLSAISFLQPHILIVFSRLLKKSTRLKRTSVMTMLVFLDIQAFSFFARIAKHICGLCLSALLQGRVEICLYLFASELFLVYLCTAQ